MNKFDLDQQESLSPRGYIVDSYPIVTKNAEIRCSTQNFHHQRKPALLTNKYSNQKYLTTRLIDGHNPNNKLSNNNHNQNRNNVNHNSEITKNSKNSSNNNNNYFHYSQNINNNIDNNISNSISTKKNHNSDLQNLSENIRNLSLPSNNDHDIIKIDKFQRETQISRLENNKTTFRLIDRNGISGNKVNVDDEAEIDVDGSSNEDEDDEILPVIGVWVEKVIFLIAHGLVDPIFYYSG